MLDQNVLHVQKAIAPVILLAWMVASQFQESTSNHIISIAQRLYEFRYIHRLEQSMSETTTQPRNSSPEHTTDAGSEAGTIGNASSTALDPHITSNEGIGIRWCKRSKTIEEFWLTIITRFMSVLFTDVQWKEQSLKLLQDLSRASTILEHSVQPNSLPSAEQGRIMFDN